MALQYLIMTNVERAEHLHPDKVECRSCKILFDRTRSILSL